MNKKIFFITQKVLYSLKHVFLTYRPSISLHQLPLCNEPFLKLFWTAQLFLYRLGGLLQSSLQNCRIRLGWSSFGEREWGFLVLIARIFFWHLCILISVKLLTSSPTTSNYCSATKTQNTDAMTLKSRFERKISNRTKFFSILYLVPNHPKNLTNNFQTSQNHHNSRHKRLRLDMGSWADLWSCMAGMARSIGFDRFISHFWYDFKVFWFFKLNYWSQI